MKFIKKLLLLLPLLLGLVSCSGGDDIVGEYSFQLGSNEGTHVAIHLNLTNDDAGVSDRPGAKKYSMVFNVGGDIFGSLSQAAGISNEEPTTPNANENIVIDGYYTIANDAQGNQMLKLGVLLFDTIDIPDDLVEMIMYATISDGLINIVIPVSVKDLQYQLYWYGYRIGGLADIINPTKLMDEDPSFFSLLLEGNDIGTVPTDNKIAAIKTYQKQRKETAADYDDSEDVFLAYHRPHTIKMGFAK